MTALRWIAVLLGALVIASLGLGLYLDALSRTLPDLKVDPDSLRTARTSIVYAADGSVIAEWHGEQDRRMITFDQMPEQLRNAVVAIEDRRFYEHRGVDTEAVLRALKVNAGSGEVQQGGSTITQQLVKILFTDGRRTLTRKIREALMSYQLEAKTPKDKVLETYLNTVYFGQGAYGVEAAARHYFGKPASALSLSESALLAGVIRSPAAYDPVTHPDAARRRRDLVLKQMADLGYIDTDAEILAMREPLKTTPPASVAIRAPYFVEWVKQDLIKRLGSEKVFSGGLRVHTTLEPQLQVYAEKAARTLPSARDPEVAIASIRPRSGQVVAMVGGRDFASNQFNLATQGKRQPGSAFKPFVLVAALERGVRPDQVFEASPYSVKVKDGVWNVQNYENAQTSGSMTLRAATNWSVNCVYARLIMRVTPKRVVDAAKRMGITSRIDPDPAIALGGLKYGVSPLEMASAYGTLANSGIHVPPTGVVKVTDDDGRVLYEPRQLGTKAVDKPVAATAALMLHDVVEQGTGVDAKITEWAAGKTGTTQSYRDAWFVGWSGDLATAVWVGNRKAQVDMTNVHGIKVTGGSYPARIWRAYMQPAVLARKTPSRPSEPATSSATYEVKVVICLDTMLLANQRCPRTTEVWLAPALVPQKTCTLH
jgi:penicillin-binding protein 1A